MTAVAVPVRRPGRSRRRTTPAELPPLSARSLLVRTALVATLIAALALLVQLTVLSTLQQRAAQQRLFDSFRASLAEGTAPVGALDSEGRALAPGTPVAFLEIPELGVRQVVVEGTAGRDLFAGPGHRRDSPLPGQAGVSIVMGRRATFGAPFARLDGLRKGDVIRTTTGQGSFEYRVARIRRVGDPLPPPPGAGEARLVLATADGRPLLPDGVLRVDAELDEDGGPGGERLFSPASLPASEQMLAADTGDLWRLAGWLQVALVLAVASVWAWHRWGRAQAWVVCFPPFVLIGLQVSNQTATLLPNLL